MTVLARDQFGAAIPVIYPGGSQNIAFTATSAQSASVGAQTTIIRVLALGADCRIVIGANPTAGPDSTPVMARVPEFFAIRPNEKLAVIREGADNGILNLTRRSGPLMSANATTHPAAQSAAEQGVFALLALIQDPDGFAKRLDQFTTAREDAAQRLATAEAQEADLTARAQEAQALKAQAEETLAIYRRELDDLARKREEIERTQSDLFQARAKMEADAAEAQREVMAKAAALKTITDGLEERERLAQQVFDQGTALQHDYAAKMVQLKSLTAAG